MFMNLKQNGLGRFQNERYWSSSEVDNGVAWNQNFTDGGQYAHRMYSSNKDTAYRVRAIRQF